jgi:molecular chaperone DnaK (HSP70)
MAELAMGIDLGTSYSAVALVIDGKPTVIPNEWGERTHASVVSFLDDGTVLVGNAAKKNIITNAENTIYSAKRFIGRRYSEVQAEIKNVPYKVVVGPNDAVRFLINGKQYSPEEISSLILRRLVDDAAKYLGEKVTAGDTHLGRDDFDKVLVDWMTNEFMRSHGIDLRTDRQALQRLTDVAEKTKIHCRAPWRRRSVCRSSQRTPPDRNASN